MRVLLSFLLVLALAVPALAAHDTLDCTAKAWGKKLGYLSPTGAVRMLYNLGEEEESGESYWITISDAKQIVQELCHMTETEIATAQATNMYGWVLDYIIEEGMKPYTTDTYYMSLEGYARLIVFREMGIWVRP